MQFVLTILTLALDGRVRRKAGRLGITGFS
jgi:hypothetical protein